MHVEQVDRAGVSGTHDTTVMSVACGVFYRDKIVTGVFFYNQHHVRSPQSNAGIEPLTRAVFVSESFLLETKIY